MKIPFEQLKDGRCTGRNKTHGFIPSAKRWGEDSLISKNWRLTKEIFQIIYLCEQNKGNMTITKCLFLTVLGLILFASACATVDSKQMTLKEWQRTHLPTRMDRS
jgi:hypothetical protein